VFNHLTERTHALEFPISRRKPELIGGHGIHGRYDQFLSGIQQGLQCVFFPLCVERRGIFCVNDTLDGLR
jgi:hypothetical protein